MTGYPGQPLQPLIRLRIFHENDNEVFDTLRFVKIILFCSISYSFPLFNTYLNKKKRTLLV